MATLHVLRASIIALLASSLVAMLAGCSAEQADVATSTDALTGADEGEACSQGVFGTPRIACASGLECVYPASTAPTGPAGSSSARTGTCERRAAEGAACSEGVFGTPRIACASGLECVYPASTAPTGPAGSSSARTGMCQAPAETAEAAEPTAS